MTNSPDHSALVILLDDCLSSAAQPSSLLLTNPVRDWKTKTSKEIGQTLQSIQDAQHDGLTVVALLSYELGEHLQVMNAREPLVPLIEAYAFREPKRLSAQQVSAWISERLDKQKAWGQPCGVINVSPEIDQDAYRENIAAIQNRIAAGETYQVNHTFKLKGSIVGDPLALYESLRKRQPVRYGAYIDTGSRKVLCFSPELFLQTADGLIKAKPMKGTRKANKGNAEELALNKKDRAENLMITDLIRNDLGRICETGSIEVPKLFEVERIGNVYQMTSTVTGRLKGNLTFADLLSATFPCGSITGAPKRHTMGIIQTVEQQPRSLYCGSIACLYPDHSIQMNVAIRTLEVDAQSRFEMGIGSGITSDSRADAEWDECMTKAGFLMSLPSPVGLIETMRAENGGIPLVKEHLPRLQKSADALRIPCNMSQISDQINSAIKNLPESPHMIRLELSPDGALSFRSAPIPEIAAEQKVFWAIDLLGQEKGRMNSNDPLLAHKTTYRDAYDIGWKRAVELGGFDAIFTNERGEVTEGGRTSIFIFIDGAWKTPALECGVLPGVMRSKLLADPDWCAKESVLYPEDILRADRVVLVNALRGVIEADRSALGAFAP